MNATAALALHERALLIDSHNDSIVAHIRRGQVGLAGEESPERRSRSGAVAYLRQYLEPLGPKRLQVNIPRMRQGGLDAAFFAVDCTRPWGNHLLYAMDALGYFLREVEEHAADIQVARSAGDIEAARKEGRLAAVLALENSNALEQSLNVLPLLHQLGVRAITLTHSVRTWAGDGCEVVGGSGLTGFGFDLVALMNELGMLVDVSHLNEMGFRDVVDKSRAPFIASHSCCRALCEHPRNLTDEQLRALGERGGVVGITFVPVFVHPSAPTLEGLLDHLEHAVEVAGIDHVGLGSDFDGGGDLLADAAELPRITAGLAARGWGEGEIRKILGENHLRLLRAVIG